MSFHDRKKRRALLAGEIPEMTHPTRRTRRHTEEYKLMQAAATNETLRRAIQRAKARATRLLREKS